MRKATCLQMKSSYNVDRKSRHRRIFSRREGQDVGAKNSVPSCILSVGCQISSGTAQNHALGIKSCHGTRSIDQGMGSELAASDPKWGVATRVGAERRPL